MLALPVVPDTTDLESKNAERESEDYASKTRRSGFWQPRQIITRIIPGLLISGFFIWLTLRGQEISAILDSLAEADYRWVLGCVLSLLVAHFVRAFRWGILLSSVGTFSFAHLNRSSAIGLMCLLLFPMRLGEFVRPWLIAQPDPGRPGKESIKMSSALGTLVYERVFDGALLSGTLSLLLYSLGSDARGALWMMRGSAFLFFVFVSIATFAWAIYRFQERALVVLGYPLSLFGQRIKSWVLLKGETMIFGLAGPEDMTKRFVFVVLSLAFWLTNAFSILVLARAFGIELSIIHAVVILTTQIVGLMIPSGPGMLGTFQFFTILGLSFVYTHDLPDGHALAFANLFWACLFVQQVGLGITLFLRRPVNSERV